MSDYNGYPGYDTASCDDCPTGATGPTGPRGPTGADGHTGATGTAGAKTGTTNASVMSGAAVVLSATPLRLLNQPFIADRSGRLIVDASIEFIPGLNSVVSMYLALVGPNVPTLHLQASALFSRGAGSLVLAGVLISLIPDPGIRHLELWAVVESGPNGAIDPSADGQGGRIRVIESN